MKKIATKVTFTGIVGKFPACNVETEKGVGDWRFQMGNELRCQLGMAPEACRLYPSASDGKCLT